MRLRNAVGEAEKGLRPDGRAVDQLLIELKVERVHSGGMGVVSATAVVSAMVVLFLVVQYAPPFAEPHDLRVPARYRHAGTSPAPSRLPETAPVFRPALDLVKLLQRIPPTKPIWVRMKPFFRCRDIFPKQTPDKTASFNRRSMTTRQMISGFVAVVLVAGAAITSAAATRWSPAHAAAPAGLMLKDIRVDVNKLAINEYEDMSLVFYKY